MEKNSENFPFLIEIQCFGNVLCWVKSVKSRQVIFEQHEHFQKTGFRNRYRVLGANGVITLSIPVVGGRETRELTREVRINNTQNWQKIHWKTLESCYNKSPFFYHYAPYLQHLFKKEYHLLWDFNMEAFNWIASHLKIQVQVGGTEIYRKEIGDEPLEDWRGRLRTSPQNEYNHSPYQQVFNREFQQNLSILDVLFNLGPETASYLFKQTTI